MNLFIGYLKLFFNLPDEIFATHPLDQGITVSVLFRYIDLFLLVSLVAVISYL